MVMSPSELPIVRPADRARAVQAVRPVAWRRDGAENAETRAARRQADARQGLRAQSAKGRESAPREGGDHRIAARTTSVVGERYQPTPAGTSMTLYLAQAIGQANGIRSTVSDAPAGAAARGSDAYRRAGGTPPLFSEDPAIFSHVV